MYYDSMALTIKYGGINLLKKIMGIILILLLLYLSINYLIDVSNKEHTMIEQNFIGGYYDH
ncbi:hypothetical protein [Kurthia sibirica]|uniref:hypothetical protein n=1 Tax=Kurthia sibirica TaxID=202750 RepID=UPI00116CEB2B|nr:hypothetical protein [Kurthia sibirica]GEK33001.1 hypothetical protein KSI01_05340 [Kurthia sibirica]